MSLTQPHGDTTTGSTSSTTASVPIAATLPPAQPLTDLPSGQAILSVAPFAVDNPVSDLLSQDSLRDPCPTRSSFQTDRVTVAVAPETFQTTQQPTREESVLDMSQFLDPDILAPGLNARQDDQVRLPDMAAATRMDEVATDGDASQYCPVSRLTIVSLGLFSAVEAQQLVQLFHQHLNPMIALLDPNLHTLEYMRATSPVLLFAVLTASSKFFRRESYASVFFHTQAVVNRTVMAGGCNAGLVQSLMILTYWKSVTDRSPWTKLGLAIRLGYQMRWHVPRTGPLPADEHQARLVLVGCHLVKGALMMLNPERTWLGLVCFDRSYSRTFDLPTAIQPNHFGDAMQWAREHSHLGVAVDVHLAFCHDLMPLTDMAHTIEYQRDLPQDYCRALVVEFKSRHEKAVNLWFQPGGSHVPQPGLSTEESQVLQWSALGPLLTVRQYALETASEADKEEAVDNCLRLSSSIVTQAEVVSQNGVLRYLQDVGARLLSTLSRFLHHVFWQLSVGRQTFVVSLLKRMYRCSLQASDGDEHAPTGFIARLIRRLLTSVSAESRTASRMPSPPPGVVPVPRDDQSSADNLASRNDADLRAKADIQPLILDGFLDLQAPVLQSDTVIDDQFWEAWFSGAPASESQVFGGQLYL